jgi:hypothetical protein
MAFKSLADTALREDLCETSALIPSLPPILPPPNNYRRDSVFAPLQLSEEQGSRAK